MDPTKTDYNCIVSTQSSHNLGPYSKVVLRMNASGKKNNDTTTLSIILKDFKKHLSKRDYSYTEIGPIITGITGAGRNQILNKTKRKIETPQSIRYG